MKGIGEGDILADINFWGKTKKIRLTNVMHLLGADGKILSLKVLDQRGFESHISGGWIHIMKGAEVWSITRWRVVQRENEIVPSQETAAIKRNTSTSNPSTWHNKSEPSVVEFLSQENRANEARREWTWSEARP